jgi:ATP-dependent Lhr-like helicase
LLSPAPSETEVAHAQALQLVERYGVLTREAVLAEGLAGGFASVYGVLKVLEERGQVRRGYFVEGLGAAQFALPGAVDRLRAEGSRTEAVDPGVDRMPWEPEPPSADRPDAWVLAATDPAQPFGASLPWPESAGQPSRSAGAHVVLVGGEACAHLERGGRRLLTFPAAANHPGWVDALAGLVSSGRARRVQLETIDGEGAAVSRWAGALERAGFVDGYKGLTLGT